MTCFLFAFRMSFSGRSVHQIYATGGQEAFFEGHMHALTTLGGVPTGVVRYDNLKAAVARVLGFSRQRVETERWTPSASRAPTRHRKQPAAGPSRSPGPRRKDRSRPPRHPLHQGCGSLDGRRQDDDGIGRPAAGGHRA